MFIITFVRENWKYLAVLAVVGFGVYAFNLSNPLFWDDDDWIINNPYVHDLSHIKEVFSQDILAGFGLRSNYFRPVLLLSYAANYIISGIEPLGYHLLSNLLHVANGLLLFALLRGLMFSRAASALAALIFLVHPVQVEAVAYISGRGDPLSVFFILIGLLLCIRSWRDKYWLYTGLAIVSMILATFSRETAFLFPVFAGIIYLFTPRAASWRATAEGFTKMLWPYILVSAIYLTLRLTVWNFDNTLNFYGKETEYTQNLAYRLYTFGHALTEYFRLMIWPSELHMERSIPIHTSPLAWQVLTGWGILLAWLGWGIKKFQTNKIWFFSSLWFVTGLVMVSGIIPINALLYEHWLYLPLIGVCVLAGYFADQFARRFPAQKYPLSAIFTLAILGYLVFFGVTSAKRNMAWGNAVAFYEDTLKYSPYNVRVINNLSNLYAKNGDSEKAARLLEELIKHGDLEFAQPYFNLGNYYLEKNDLKRAEELYIKAIEVDPNFHFAYKNLATIYAKAGDLVKAKIVMERLVALTPDDAFIYYNLGIIEYLQGNRAKSIQYLKTTVEKAEPGSNIANMATEALQKIGK